MKIYGYMFVYIYIFCPFSELKLCQNVLLFFYLAEGWGCLFLQFVSLGNLKEIKMLPVKF